MSQVTELIERAWAARRESRLDDGLEAVAEALRLARVGSDGRDLVRALAACAQLERDRGDTDAALPLLEEATERARALGDESLLAHTMRHLGDLHHEAGRTEEAVDFLKEAVAIYRAHAGSGDLDLANAIRPLAIVRAASEQVGEARTLWREARTLYARAGSEAGVEEADDWLERLS